MGHLVKHGLGHALLSEQVFIVHGNQITLLQHRILQAAQAIHGLYFRFENDPVVGFSKKVITAGLKATHQGFAFGQ